MPTASPSSSTTSSRPAGFLAWCLGPLVAWAVGLCGVGVAVGWEPVTGDLTRIGGHAERDFGWTGEQERVAPTRTRKRARYDETADVLVIGDSFSNGVGGSHWQDDFLRATGLGSVTLHYEKAGDWQGVAATPFFRAHPPRVVVFECAEYRLGDFFGGRQGDAVPAPTPALPAMAVAPAEVPVERFTRTQGMWPGVLDFPGIQDHVYKRMIRPRLGQPDPLTALVPLTRGGLFSSREDRTLLAYHRMADKARWGAATIRGIQQTLVQLQNAFQAGGRTYFVAMLAPDKTTAYDAYLADPAWRGLGRLAAIDAVAGLHVARVAPALDAAIAAGTRDVYLPDDTHWGPAGHRVAGEALAAYLRDQGQLAGGGERVRGER